MENINLDVKKKLEDEMLFANLMQSKKLIGNLNKKGIFTIEDFINSDIDFIATKDERRKQFRAFKKILKYKYLGEPLVLDVLLDKEYFSEKDITYFLRKDFMALGFGAYIFNSLAIQILNQNGTCKIIDVISVLDKKFDFLKEFYIEYYKNQQKEKFLENTLGKNDKDTLDELKNQLVSLLNRKNELDLQISSLLEQINTLKGGRIVNGR